MIMVYAIVLGIICALCCTLCAAVRAYTKTKIELEKTKDLLKILH